MTRTATDVRRTVSGVDVFVDKAEFMCEAAAIRALISTVVPCDAVLAAFGSRNVFSRQHRDREAKLISDPTISKSGDLLP